MTVQFDATESDMSQMPFWMVFSAWSIDFFTARDFVQLQLRLYLNREGALTTSRGFFYVL